MKIRIPYMLLLAGALVLPATAQLAPADNQASTTSTSQTSSPAVSSETTTSAQSPQSSSSSSSSSAQSAEPSSSPSSSSDENLSARQPLEPEYHQGFWGKLNPFARKKYVQRQLSPIRNRVNELDDLTAANSKAIKDVDARAQEGIRIADAKATQADLHAMDASNRAQQADQNALQASNRLNTVEQVVGNIDQYHATAQTEIRFRAGQTALSPKAKQALDDMTSDLKDQKGYIIQVQGFSPSGIQSSQAMANSVVRYLVEKNEVPLYRIFVMGLGNAKLPAMADNDGKPTHSNRVEISLLKNNVDQLESMNQPATPGQMGPATQGSNSGSYSTSKQSAPSQQPSSKATSNSTPASSTPHE
jgi:outer membrane protein OmpA-like peptidoglycan-associated protein